LVSKKGYIDVSPIFLVVWEIVEETPKSIPSHVSRSNLKGDKVR
jgi:hypothetical protein